jgi:hypothetical protein
MDGVNAREIMKGVKGDRTASASQTPIAIAWQTHWGNCHAIATDVPKPQVKN